MIFFIKQSSVCIFFILISFVIANDDEEKQQIKKLIDGIEYRLNFTVKQNKKIFVQSTNRFLTDLTLIPEKNGNMGRGATSIIWKCNLFSYLSRNVK